MDMKEFLDEYSFKREFDKGAVCVTTYDLFKFFWERGGKQFAKFGKNEETGLIDVNERIELANELMKSIAGECFAQDFLDCVELDEERIKKLIGEMKWI